MDVMLKLKLIKQAQKFLVDNSQDPMHDIAHHSRVVEIARELVRVEKLEAKLDQDIVEVICWWHDVKVPEITHPADQRVVAVTAKYLSEQFSDKSELVYDSVLNHEFGSQPKHLEGKVLQDADKLEILSASRVAAVVDNVRAGNLDSQKMLLTMNSIKTDWLPKMPELYHFECSRKLHEEKLPGFLRLLAEVEVELSSMKRS